MTVPDDIEQYSAMDPEAVRCPWVGPKSKNQCDKLAGHEGPHRTFPGVEELLRDTYDEES